MSSNTRDDSPNRGGNQIKRPDERNTTDREEMICPKCLTEGLEENPAYKDEYTGRVAILKSSRCSNTDCRFHYGVPEEKVERQMPDSTVLSSLRGIFSTDFSTRDAATAVVVILSLVLIAQSFGIFSSQQATVTTTIDGVVVSDSAELRDISVNIVDSKGNLQSSTTIDENGSYTARSVPPGTYRIDISPTDNTQLAGTSVSQVVVDNDGELFLDGERRAQGEPIQTRIPQAQTVSANQTVSNADFNINFANPSNADRGVQLQLTPVNEGTINKRPTISAGQNKTLISPTPIINQRLQVNGIEKTSPFTRNYQYNGTEQQYTIKGNLPAKSGTISLTDSSSTPVQSKSVRVTRSKQVTINVNGEKTLGDVDFIFDDGTATATEQKTGTWRGEDLEIDTPAGGFVNGSIVIEPKTVTESETITGQISGSQITVPISGTLPATNAYLNFSGGTAKSTVQASDTVSATAESGTVTQTKQLLKADEDTDFRLNLEPATDRNASLVNYWYSINSKRTQIKSSQADSISLNKGDILRLGVKSTRPVFGPYESPDDGDESPVEIREISFSDTNPSPGESVDVTATIHNPKSSSKSKTLTLYADGDRQFSTSSRVDGKETTEQRMGSVTFSESGTHTVHITDSDAKLLHVGDNPERYGVGEISGTLNRVGEAGKVQVDTNGNGEFDCTVPSRRGSCRLGQLSTGPTQIDVNQQSVTNTQYNLSYTQRTRAKGVSVDAGKDGSTEIDQTGLLKSEISENIQLPPNGTSIGISTENNVAVDYGVVWTTQKGIDNPSVYINGTRVISNAGSFSGPRSFETIPLPRGEHTVRFVAGSGSYTAEVQWQENGSATYPAALADGKRVCDPSDFAGDLECKLPESAIQSGVHTLAFSGGSEEFRYQLAHKARTVPPRAVFKANGQRYVLARSSPTPQEWQKGQSIDQLTVGENNIGLTTPAVDGVDTDATATVAYSFNVIPSRNVSVSVISPNGTGHTVSLPESAVSNNRLVQQATLDLPSEWFSRGTNRVRISSENAGVVTAETQVVSGQQDIISVSRR